MQVRLEIKDDAELRKHIRDLIKGEITGIARQEIVNILKEVLDKKAVSQHASESAIRNLVQDEIRTFTRAQLNKGHLFNVPVEDIIRASINARLHEVFQKMGLNPDQIEIK